MYTGRRPRTVIEPAVEEHEVEAVTVEVDYMVGFKVGDIYKIGKVTTMQGDNIKVELYRGTINGVWEPVSLPNGRCPSQTIKADQILDGHIFTLTPSRRLPTSIKSTIKPLL